MAQTNLTVKAVPSGDTVVLVSHPKGGPPPEKVVHLEFLVAPKVALKSLTQERTDEPHGWASREYLRKLLIGQKVDLKSVAKVNDREEGWISVDGTVVNTVMVREGFAKLRTIRPEVQSPEYKELEQLQRQAQDAKRGIWSSAPTSESIREVSYPTNEGVREFINSRRGKVVDAICEYVRDGSAYRLLFTEDMVHCQVGLSGVLCGQWKRSKPDDKGAGEYVAEEYAEEAKYIVEMRILHRDLQARIDGCDDFGNAYVSIRTPTGDDLAVVLLKMGLGRVQDWSAKMSPKPSALREAQKEAQTSQLRKWKNYEVGALSEKTYKARVVQVVSGDSISILPAGETEEKRVFLASVRAPKMKSKVKGEDPWATEARDFLRQRWLGKEVQVYEEYSRPPLEGNTLEQSFVTVIRDGQMATEELVEAGLATTAPHRKEDPRARNYDTLLTCQEKAKEAGKGVHSPNSKPRQPVNELLGTKEGGGRAKAFERDLKDKTIDGIIEHIFHVGRYKVTIPSLNIAISYILGDINCLRPPSVPGQQAYRKGAQTAEEDKVGKNGLKWARLNLMQRDVVIKPAACDRGGNFLGSLWLKSKGGNENVSIMVVAQGFCWVREATGDPEIFAKLKETEEEARKKNIGVHQLPDSTPNTQTEEIEKRANFPSSVEITYVNDTVELFVVDREKVETLSQIQETLHESSLEEGGESAFAAAKYPKQGDYLMCKFEVDSSWYRAKILSLEKDGAYVQYIDFGNTELRPFSVMRRLPASVGVDAFPPFAQPCALAGLREINADTRQEIREAVTDRVSEVCFNCTCDYFARGTTWVILSRQASTGSSGSTPAPSLNEELVEQGLTRVDSHPLIKKKCTIYESLVAAQEVAKKARRFIWKHGDCGTDPED